MRVLLIEDENALATLTRLHLGRNTFAVDAVTTLEEARAALRSSRYDVVVLDLTLPDGDGLSLLTELRRGGWTVPVIAVTARDAVAQRVQGLNAGVDDYLIKPFDPDELIARLRALLRRPGTAYAQTIRVGALALDTASMAVTAGGQTLALPRRQLALLELLMRGAGRVVTRETIDNGLYGFDDIVETNAVEALISRLRRVLAEAGADVTIHTVRGVGYMLAAS